MAEQACYLDTSALLPLYRLELLSEKVEALLERMRPVISPLVEVEVASAVARWLRTGELTVDQAHAVDRAFAEDLQLGALQRCAIEERHYWQARTWLMERRTALRTLDSLHLACAADQGLTLVTADRLFAEAASTLGVDAAFVA